jgi:hypothetical protein
MTIHNRRGWMLPVLITMAFVATFIITRPVSADDTVPVDPQPTEEVVSPPVETTVATEVPAAATTTPEPTLEATPAPTQVATQKAVENSTTDKVKVKVDGQIILVDATGQTVSAEEATGDPYFTIGTTKYSFMKPGGCSGISSPCTESTAPIQAAIVYLSVHNVTPTDRTIYIEPDTYSDNVFIDGTTNGVKGLTALKGMGSTATDVNITGRIQVEYMANGFSISNLSVNNTTYTDTAAIWMEYNTGLIKLTDINATAAGTDSSGIVVAYNWGSVELNRVAADGSGYHGAYIENLTTGTVKVTNSEFNSNLNYVDNGNTSEGGIDGYWDENEDWNTYAPSFSGLNIYNNGSTTLYGVNVESNKGNGADIFGNSIAISNSTFDNNKDSVASGWDTGLYIGGYTVNLQNVEASKNGNLGINTSASTSFIANVLQTVGNGNTGLQVSTCEDWGDDTKVCDNPGSGIITIITYGSNNNGGDGIDLYSKGAVTLSNIYSGWNGGDGIYLDNADGLSAAAVTLTAVQTPGNDTGTEIYSKGAVTLNNFTADNNSGDGLSIDNTYGTNAAVTITNVASNYNETCSNGGNGYTIKSNGAVSITNLDSYNNTGGYGASIDNSTASSSAPVTIKTLGNGYNGLDSNNLFGLDILSKGAVTITNTDISANKAYGTYIDNTYGTGAITITATVIDNNDDGNDITHGAHGIYVTTKGAITLTDVEVERNDGYGAYFVNSASSATPGITINAINGNYFTENSGTGLEIHTKGAVTLTNLNTSSNGSGGSGLVIDNSLGTAGVTIKTTKNWGGYTDQNGANSNNTSFSNNEGDGLNITTKGTVSIVFNEANSNSGTGIVIQAAGGSGTVSLGGTSSYTGNVKNNFGTGLDVQAKGNITVTNIWADFNGGAGARLTNLAGTGAVTLTNAWFENNNSGITINTTGAVIWKNGSASGNFLTGAVIDNDVALVAGKPVTLTNVQITYNGDTGLSIDSKGVVTLVDTECNNNSANGWTISYDDLWYDNLNDGQTWVFDSNSSVEDVTIHAESSRFTPSLYVTDADGNWLGDSSGSDGTVTLTLTDLPADTTYYIHVDSDSSYKGFSYQISINTGDTVKDTSGLSTKSSAAHGVMIDNSNGNGAGVNFTNSSQRWNGNNSDTDIYILTSGAVVINNTDINDSSADGLYIDNRLSTKNAGITVTNVNFWNNDGIGAKIQSKGAIVYTNGNSGSNFGDGLNFKTTNAITLNSVNAENNGEDGIDINAGGAVTFNNVNGRWNSGHGAVVNTTSTFTTIKPISGSYNRFNENGSTGLYVTAGGKVILARTNASDNGYREDDGTPTSNAYGIFVDNSANLTGIVPVILTDIYAINNTKDGVHILTTSPITINTLIANDNSNSGAYIQQTAATPVKAATAVAVTLIDVTVNNNGHQYWLSSDTDMYDGLYVNVVGNIVVNRVNSASNSGKGANLSNTAGSGTVTVSGKNTLGTTWLGMNGGAGLNVQSNGAITVSDIELFSNADGIVLDSSTSTAVIHPAITMTKIYTHANNANGAVLKSKGVITINNTWSANNANDGLNLIATNNYIFINNTTSIGNGYTGVYAHTGTGTLRLTNSTWFGNLKNDSLGDKNLMNDGTIIY